MPPKTQTGRGQVGSRIAEALEESYIDLESYILTKSEYIKDRFKLINEAKKIQFIQKYVSKMQSLLDSISPNITECLNREFPDMLFTPNTYYEQPFYANIRKILDFILTADERRRFQQSRAIIPFYERILERFNNEAFFKSYLDEYSGKIRKKPFNIYAFYLVRTLKHRLKIDIKVCMYHLERRRMQEQQRSQAHLQTQPRDTPEYKNRLATPERNAFTYKWLKTYSDIQSVCKDDDEDDDDCDCAILMTPLEPNKAFSVSYELNGKPYTDCYDDIIIYREAAMPYKYYRHPILKDKYIDMGAIRALKAAANATGGAPALKATKSNAKGGGAPTLKAAKSNAKDGGGVSSGNASATKSRAVVKKKQTGRGQVGSLIAERLEETYYDMLDFIETRHKAIKDRFRLSTMENKTRFLKKHITKIQELLNSITPTSQELSAYLNRFFPKELFVVDNDNTTRLDNYYGKLRPVVRFILTTDEHMQMYRDQNILDFYNRILERFNNEAFFERYLDEYSGQKRKKPFNIHAFFLVRTLKRNLTLAIQISRQNLSQQASLRRTDNIPPEKSNFTYKWLKTPEDIKATCKITSDYEPDLDDIEEKDETGNTVYGYDCTVLMEPLKANKAFSVSYEMNGKPFTECYDEYIISRNAAKNVRYYRHPILRDQYIDMNAIRALKVAANAPGISGSSTGGKRVRSGASKRV